LLPVAGAGTGCTAFARAGLEPLVFFRLGDRVEPVALRVFVSRRFAWVDDFRFDFDRVLGGIANGCTG
jgi:hypothetical protein